MKRRDVILGSAIVGSMTFLSLGRLTNRGTFSRDREIGHGLALPKSGTTQALVRSFSTDFTGVENPLSEGGAWSSSSLYMTRVMKSNGLACGTLTGTGGYNDSYARLSGFAPDQIASATIHLVERIDASCTHEVEILLRCSDSSDSVTGYECHINFHGECQIIRWNGPFGDFTILDEGSARLKSGDVLKASAIGNVITMYLNGVRRVRVTDSKIATGNPGIGFFRRNCGTNMDFGFTSFTARSFE
jgi:hypothetical protein